jgi:hypothetical protein
MVEAQAERDEVSGDPGTQAAVASRQGKEAAALEALEGGEIVFALDLHDQF